MIIRHKILAVVSLGAMAMLVAACSSSSPFSGSRRINTTPQNLPPVQSSSVQSSQLPPLQGQDGVLTTDNRFDPNIGDPGLNGQLVSADGSFVTFDDVGGGTTPGGRDLSGGLTAAKLLGAWTVNADLKTCRLNLTQTTKSGTSRYRASAPGCEVPVLSLVSSWQLTGNQVQLYDESGSIIGALQLTGNRFIGTLSGGLAVTMEG